MKTPAIPALAGARPMTVLIVLLFNFFSYQSFAQCPLACNNVQASLDENCEIEVTWDMLAEGNLPPSCASELLVEIFDQAGMLIPTSPVITGDYVNETLTGVLTHLPTGNSCTSSILVEDKLAPTLTCTDTLISCFHDVAPTTTGFPFADDNCTDTVFLNFNDAQTTFDCADSDTVQIITRMWTASDSSGNTSTCTQKIFIEKPSLSDLTFPPDHNGMQAPVLYCNSADTSIANTGVPNFSGTPVDSLCSFLVDYQDVVVPICDGSHSVFREWEVYDGCAGETMEHEQIINVMDTLPPALSCPDDITVNTSNNGCTATVQLPQPAVFDSCSNEITMALTGSFGIVNGMTIPSLGQGTYETTCIATDGCGNSSNCQFEITVRDNVPPVAVGVSSPIISLLPQEPTYLPASTFDGGSWDNCDDLTLEVRRLDNPNCPGDDSTPFDTLVPFFCCDVGQTVSVQLRVTDVGGNSSMVTSLAQVQDNLEPEVTCPADLTIDCHEDYLDLSLTGEPIVLENCPDFTMVFIDSVNLTNCGSGTVSRSWIVSDLGGFMVTCEQTITISNLTPFYINSSNPNDPDDDIVWPENYTSSTCGAGLDPEDLPAGFGYPEIITDSVCQMIGVSYADTWLTQPTNSCIEILRSWTVIDWCQFNQTTFEGSWTYAQIIRIENSDPPVITSICEASDFCSYDPDCQFGTPLLFVEAEDDCTPSNLLETTYEIDYFDDGTIDGGGTGNEVETSHPLGTHRITFTVEDGCQNSTTCSYLFSISDCKEPTPVCEALIVEISDDLDPTVWVSADEFDGGSYDNCTQDEDLEFTFSPNPSDSTRQFDCLALGQNEVEIWVTDLEGNQDFCTVMLEVQANTNACTDQALVAGVFETEDGDSVAQVMVHVNSQTLADSMVTDLDGTYAFPNLDVGGDYSVTPAKDINPLNGVTTFDLVLISKHILGVQPLSSPYTIIAADANRSGAVTTADLVALRKLILNIDQEFQNNTSWRFVDKSFEFSDPTDPFEDEFPEIISINDLSDDVQADFVAIKIGDVNGSAVVEE